MTSTTRDVTQLINYRFAKRYGVLATMQDEQLVLLHHADLTAAIITECRRLLPQRFTWQRINAEQFQQLLAQHYQINTSSQTLAEDMTQDMDLRDIAATLPTPQDLLESQNEAPIIRLINAILTEAIHQQATDVHIETFEENLIVRLRIDGVLHNTLTLQRVLAPLVISRIKVMAKLDIAEKRLPQDGRISLQIAGHTIDVRVSTLPAKHAERIVMRLLDKSAAQLALDKLGMTEEARQSVQKLLQHPHGIILVTGPTGSGKTTTLCAMLLALHKPTRNILTVEDPIEYEMPGIGQTQVNPKIDLTFAKGLRAILRQDPDVVMIGEIRDSETAQIAVQASLTGHLVLSTLHTNTAIGAISRLTDMGIEPFLLASSTVGVIAQRLVRLLCLTCRTTRMVSRQEAQLLGCGATTMIHDAKGCPACNQTGYKGRSGIYEIMVIDDALRRFIHDRASEQSIEEYVRQHSISIAQYGYQRVLRGETTLSEVLRVTTED